MHGWCVAGFFLFPGSGGGWLGTRQSLGDFILSPFFLSFFCAAVGCMPCPHAHARTPNGGARRDWRVGAARRGSGCCTCTCACTCACTCLGRRACAGSTGCDGCPTFQKRSTGGYIHAEADLHTPLHALYMRHTAWQQWCGGSTRRVFCSTALASTPLLLAACHARSGSLWAVGACA